MEEKKERTFEEIKDEIVVNQEVTPEQENIIVEAARRETELERARNRQTTPR